jgi:hypothetical protein
MVEPEYVQQSPDRVLFMPAEAAAVLETEVHLAVLAARVAAAPQEEPAG